ncbi:MAG TPA: LysR substrate-binding domain-containing protein, partial [Sphingomicrobium sp.]|nr:LysR substrate-binding domain-containing protein [Sphingomicrobium sp.]
LATPYACGDVEVMDLFDDELLLAFPPHENPPQSIPADAIDEHRLLLLEDGHCLKDHALAACNRPQLRAEARMLGTSLHTLVQMVDNGLGLTLIPQMAVSAGILDGTGIVTRHLDATVTSRRIALAWRRGSPRAAEFRMLGDALIEAQQPA